MSSKLYKQLKSELIFADCQMVRQGKGSHEIWHSPLNNKNFTVPTNIKSKILEKAIMKQAGIPQ